MTKTNSTRKSLLLSVTALLLCCAMLAGTTFAWFTDSVSSGRNAIVAGNLDVELHYWNGEAYQDATGASLFDDAALWEPGHTEVVYLQVKNVGTLALTYQLGLNVAIEQPGTNQAGETFLLSDSLRFKVVESGEDLADSYEDRAAARAAEADETRVGNYQTAETTLYPTGGEDPSARYLALIVYMPESVGNEANHMTGTDAPSIQLRVDLVAKQAPVEADSFGSDYDVNATYPFTLNGETLYLTRRDDGLYTNALDPEDKTLYAADKEGLERLAQLSNEGSGRFTQDIGLAADIDLQGAAVPTLCATFQHAFAGTFDGGGHTLSNAKFTAPPSSGTTGYGGGLIAQSVGGSVKNLTLQGCTVNEEKTRYNIVGAVMGYQYGSAVYENVHVIDCTVYGYGKVGGIVGYVSDPGHNIEFRGCTVENTTLVGAYNVGGLIGLVLPKNTVARDAATTVDVTWTHAEGEAENKYVIIEDTIACQPDAHTNCPGNGVAVQGQRWVHNGYAYGAFATWYVAYGDSSHDCELTVNSFKLANSEICIDELAPTL